jgi:virginiamycin B lyase
VFPEATRAGRCFDRRVRRRRTIEEENMKTTTRIRIVALAGLVFAVSGVVVAHALSLRHAARPRVGKVVARIRIPANSGVLAVAQGAVWTTSDAVPILIRIDPATNSIVARTRVESKNPCPELPGSCGEAAAGNGALWIARTPDDSVLRVDPRDLAVAARIHVGPQPEGIATTPGAVWVVNRGGPSVSRIDPATNKVAATIPIGPQRACCSDHMAVAAGAGGVWASLPSLHRIVRIDPATNDVVARVRLSGEPCAFVTAGERDVWAAGGHCIGAVLRLNPRTNRAGRAVHGMASPIGLAVGFGSLWVADLDAKTIDRVNPRTGRIVARLRVGGYPVRLASGFGSVWVRDDTGRVLRIKPQR